MKKEFLRVFGQWIETYKADIMGKVEQFLKDTDSDPEELADVIDVDVDEIYDILDGNGENISVETFGKLLLASGFALEIKPIAATPLKGYEHVNPHVMRDNMEDEPQPNPFMHRPIGGAMPPYGMPPIDFRNIPPHVRERMERDFNPQVEHPRPHREEAPTSPFASMSRNELASIIRKKLWDSEIDLNSATTRELVKFLEEKDKRMKEVIRNEKAAKSGEELERDPHVADFVKRMKKTIKENPQFRSYMKNFIGGLEDEE